MYNLLLSSFVETRKEIERDESIVEGGATVSGEVKKNILSKVKIENKHNKEVVSDLTDFTSPRTEL